MIFDITNRKSYEEIEEWVSEMFEILQKDIPFIIIGNKLDLLKDIGYVIDLEVVRAFAEKKWYLY